ncbi:hypothetical protein IC762_07865 [Bradyrhizobium genosp. L]|uniref:hypothetical protein n=1 Tax=Bradyrhizobium genosp. L TaxID=83637 RepID=UPI0018A2F07C|nr:hypothetical protein [Bradyrhizobium genosp. L]QPF88017.1 hypothetical protein IC762_07865 [Bradyrhizobium genosp. L]
MSIFASKTGLAIVLAALCLDGQQALAQSAPVQYWTAGSLFGFGGSLADAQKADAYGNFPSFGDPRAQGGNAYLNGKGPDGWFMGSEGGRFGLTGLGQSSAFGSYEYQGAQVGYNFKSGDGSSPVTFFAGFDSLKYNPPGAGGPLAPFSSSSSTNAGYAARAGIEYRPTSNLSLSIGASFAQPQAERMDSDINSPLLPGQSPLLFGGR